MAAWHLAYCHSTQQKSPKPNEIVKEIIPTLEVKLTDLQDKLERQILEQQVWNFNALEIISHSFFKYSRGICVSFLSSRFGKLCLSLGKSSRIIVFKILLCNSKTVSSAQGFTVAKSEGKCQCCRNLVLNLKTFHVFISISLCLILSLYYIESSL